jgi:predicted transcriptional regulator
MSREAAVDATHLSRFPREEVSQLIQQHLNYFPELEQAAERLVRDESLDADTMHAALGGYLKRVLKVEVQMKPSSAMQGAIRSYDPDRRVLALADGLGRGRRHFQLAYQIGLLTQADVITRLTSNPLLTTDESRTTCRVALANYFAAAVLMPYADFLSAALRERYDIELLGRRFNTSFEQTCHRLATLQRPGAEGIPLHMIRVDIAGNMSKHFSLSGLQISRFSGACPRWNTFKALLTPGLIRVQLSQMPDGKIFFGVARTVHNESGRFTPSRGQYAVGIGCDVERAKDMVYADGLNLSSDEGIVPVGPACRLCERTDCEDRAYPPTHRRFAVDENRRGIAFYAPPPGA